MHPVSVQILVEHETTRNSMRDREDLFKTELHYVICEVSRKEERIVKSSELRWSVLSRVFTVASS